MVGMTDNNELAQIGVVGLAVMGSNIARNFAHKGHTVAVYNRSRRKLAPSSLNTVMKAHSSRPRPSKSSSLHWSARVAL